MLLLEVLYAKATSYSLGQKAGIFSGQKVSILALYEEKFVQDVDLKFSKAGFMLIEAICMACKSRSGDILAHVIVRPDLRKNNGKSCESEAGDLSH